MWPVQAESTADPGSKFQDWKAWDPGLTDNQLSAVEVAEQDALPRQKLKVTRLACPSADPAAPQGRIEPTELRCSFPESNRLPKRSLRC